MVTAAATPLLTLEEARELAGNRPGRMQAYNEARLQGTFLGVRVIRVGRKYWVPRAALEVVLAGSVEATCYVR